MSPYRFSILIAARKNSKYLAKFLFGLMQNSDRLDDMQVLVMLNKEDTWNNELVDYWESHAADPDISFYREDYRWGRAGLHQYFNDLYEHASGSWIIYFCEDHFIAKPGWDTYLRRTVEGLDWLKPHCIVPKFDNAGAMNHILSTGYCDAVGGIAKHGWVDSYINALNARIGKDFPIRQDDETFHDFTHDKPSPMSDSHSQSVISEEGKKLPKYYDALVTNMLDEDAVNLKGAIDATNRG